MWKMVQFKNGLNAHQKFETDGGHGNISMAAQAVVSNRCVYCSTVFSKKKRLHA